MARWRIKLWTPVHHGAPPISRYTHVLRAAHGRVKVHSIRGSDHYNCTWTVAHVTLCLFCLFRVDWFPISSLSTSNRRAWAPPHWHNERKITRAGWLPKLSLVLLFTPITIKMAQHILQYMLFFGLMSWWFHLSVFKFTFEACFACSAQYF